MRDVAHNLAGPALCVTAWLLLLANAYTWAHPRHTPPAPEACHGASGVTYAWDASPDRSADTLDCRKSEAG